MSGFNYYIINALKKITCLTSYANHIARHYYYYYCVQEIGYLGHCGVNAAVIVNKQGHAAVLDQTVQGPTLRYSLVTHICADKGFEKRVLFANLVSYMYIIHMNYYNLQGFSNLFNVNNKNKKNAKNLGVVGK